MNRVQFLKWAEGLLGSHAAMGAKLGGKDHYRLIRVAPMQYLGIDALVSGTLRVHLFSNVDRHKERWKQVKTGLGRKTPTKLVASLPPLPPEALSRLQVLDNGPEHRGHLRFEWEAESSDYAIQQEPVRQYMDWLCAVVGKQ